MKIASLANNHLPCTGARTKSNLAGQYLYPRFISSASLKAGCYAPSVYYSNQQEITVLRLFYESFCPQSQASKNVDSPVIKQKS